MNFVTSFVCVLVTSCFFSQSTVAAPGSNEIPYYGEAFYKDLAISASKQSLVQKLQTILHSTHKIIPGDYDQISTTCTGEGCYCHISLGYDRARTFLMGVHYLVKEDSGYAIRDVYCSRLKHANEFEKNPPGPNLIPEGTVLNTEHTWPQSKFTGTFDREMQKSDLHHLYPTDSQMNSKRGNLEFGDVFKDDEVLKCADSHLGLPIKGGNRVFQPPRDHIGNAARAIFYFSIQYDMPVGPEQEATLRRWNKADPVDAEEVIRNIEIMKIQGNRNPFVDHPNLIDRILDF